MIPSVERRYSTHRGFLRACATYRGRILAYIALPLGTAKPYRLVLAKPSTVQP